MSEQEHVGHLISGLIDGELTQQEAQRVRVHCEACDECRAELEALTELRSAVQRTGVGASDAWHERIPDTPTQVTRSIGWIALLVGVAVAIGVGLYEFLPRMGEMPLSALVVIFGVYGGLLLLLISVLRQRLLERKTDKFKDVEI